MRISNARRIQWLAVIGLSGLMASGCSPGPTPHAGTIRPAITEDDINSILGPDPAVDDPAEKNAWVRVSAGGDSEPARFAGMVSAHNQVRATVASPALRWSSALAQQAQRWADHLRSAMSCAMAHSHAENVGENLAWASGQRLTPASVVGMWANEARDFDPVSGRCASGSVCGHYTQVVWKSTREVGCGMASCGRNEVWVCNYSPPGNWVGEHPF